jgi:hypothetical protein
MRRIELVLAVASMAVLLVAFAAPAMADDFNHHFFDNPNHFFNPFNNDNGIFQSSEQNVQSGDSSQTFNVTGGGDNSNSCQGVQGISNTGNSVNSTNVLQSNPSFDGFNNGFFHPFFNQDEVGVFNSGNFEISPTSTTTCTQSVNQAASASG